MATINFYLDKPDRKGKRPIILTYLLNGKKFRFSTKLKTTEKAWDSKNQRIKKNADSESTINYSLKEFIHVIELAEHNAKLGHYKLTLDTIRAKLLEHAGKIDGVKDLFQVFEEYIEVAKSTKTPNTVKGYTTCLQKLKEFSTTKKYILNFESIDLSLIHI